MPSDKETDWIYRESTKKLLMRLLLAGCVISVLLELFVLGRKKSLALMVGSVFMLCWGLLAAH